MITVELIYAASAQQQSDIHLQLLENCTIEMAIQQSGILQQIPEIDLNQNKVGIFGKVVSLDTILHDGDRIEIYRPLVIDPKIARLQRAQRQKKSRQKSR